MRDNQKSRIRTRRVQKLYPGGACKNMKNSPDDFGGLLEMMNATYRGQAGFAGSWKRNEAFKDVLQPLTCSQCAGWQQPKDGVPTRDCPYILPQRCTFQCDDVRYSVKKYRGWVPHDAPACYAFKFKKDAE